MEKKLLSYPNENHHEKRLRVSKQPSRGLCVHLAFAMLLLVFSGCGGEGRELAPITGKVLFRGKPLPFGGVMFQSSSGQPATAVIQPDGSFEMKTHGEGAGAAVGRNKVRITCSESQDPNRKSASAGGELALGRRLIPKRYGSFHTSKLEVDIKPDQNEPLLFELTGK